MNGFFASLVIACAATALACFGSEMLGPLAVASENPLVFDSPARTLDSFQLAEKKAARASKDDWRDEEILLLEDRSNRSSFR
jgi:hypothetical protein